MTYLNRIAPEAAAPHHLSDWAPSARTKPLLRAGQTPPATLAFPSPSPAQDHFDHLDTSITPEDRAFWCFMKPTGRPSFTVDMLGDLARMQAGFRSRFAGLTANEPRPFDYYVLGSNIPGIFNLGGDLVLFRQKIEQRDEPALRAYAHRCVEVVYGNYTGFDSRVITIALAEGDALGGGLEAALACDVIVAERQAKFGLPEILFNLFPGMGAYSYLSRRIGTIKAEEMIMSGAIYSAEEMHALGVVDVLVEPGEGRTAVKEYIAANRSRTNVHASLYQVRRRVNAVTLQELRDVTDIWVDSALRLTEADLRKMSRIAAAQDRSLQRRAAAFAIAAE
jgi:DSF synthase